MERRDDAPRHDAVRRHVLGAIEEHYPAVDAKASIALLRAAVKTAKRASRTLSEEEEEEDDEDEEAALEVLEAAEEKAPLAAGVREPGRAAGLGLQGIARRPRHAGQARAFSGAERCAHSRGPNLQGLAMILLTLVPTSVGNERRFEFSTTNYVFNEFRSRLAVDTLEECLRLHASRDLYGTLAEFPIDEVYKRWKECERRSAHLAAEEAGAASAGTGGRRSGSKET